MVNAALDGKLAEMLTEQEPFFGLHIPLHCPGVPDTVLQPRQTWPDPALYDDQAEKLTKMFAANFKQFSEQTTPEVRQSGPS